MLKGRLISVAGVTLAVFVSSAPSALAQAFEIGHIPVCTEAVPAAVATPGGAPGPLNVRVLLDGVDVGTAQSKLTPVGDSYGPLGLNVAFTYQAVAFSGTDAESLIQQSKAVFGGVRPAGVDVVYTLTSKDIQLGGQTAVAGLADCIGGVAFSTRAFAVGELFTQPSFSIGPARFLVDITAKVASHEIGHLMGGHHHYANCVEGIPTDPTDATSVCTLMINDVGLASLNFSTVNSSVVRGHAEAYMPAFGGTPSG